MDLKALRRAAKSGIDPDPPGPPGDWSWASELDSYAWCDVQKCNRLAVYTKAGKEHIWFACCDDHAYRVDVVIAVKEDQAEGDPEHMCTAPGCTRSRVFGKSFCAGCAP